MPATTPSILGLPNFVEENKGLEKLESNELE